MTTKIIGLVGLLAVVGTATGYVVTRRPNLQASNNSPEVAAVPVAVRSEKVNRILLPNQLRWALKQLGDRLEHSGKERLTISAELQQSAGSAPVQLILEFPDRLRLMVQDTYFAPVVTFDGNQASALGRQPDRRERQVIESLIYDSAEHFFISHTRGSAVRSLGNRFHTDDGLQYDIYELTDAVNVDTATRVQSKRFYFNSDTQLLEKVRYAIERDGATVQVETRFGDWKTSEQQRFPARITRIENGKPVWTLSVASAVLSPMLNDGVFATL
jgi:hypothetical protein